MTISENYEMLLSTVSHEIRNPVTLIHSYLQLISAAHPEVSSYEYWDTVGEEMKHLKILLTELSYFNNSTRIRPVMLNLSSWMPAYVLHTRAFLRTLFQTGKADIPFSVNLSDDLPIITVDPDKLQQVLDNLIRNAAEAISVGSITDHAPLASGQITFSVNARDSHIQFTISDNGCGITEEQMPHLFEPFVSYKRNGSGLGLAISERIIKAHHGTITVHSEPSSGTSFVVTLPAVL